MPNHVDGATIKSVRRARVLSDDADRGSVHEVIPVKISHPPEKGAQQSTSNSTNCAVEPVRSVLNPQQTGLRRIGNNPLRFVPTDALESASRSAALLERVRLQLQKAGVEGQVPLLLMMLGLRKLCATLPKNV
jgi:hypothetical protein